MNRHLRGAARAVLCLGLCSGAAFAQNPALPPSTATLSANPASITSGPARRGGRASGQSSVLSWSSTNATSCTGNGFSTGGLTSGSVSVSLSVTTAYVISCSGAGDAMSASATVGVLSSTGFDARTFSPSPHAGTLADPWPGSAIVSAILSLPDSGGTVWVADGIWQFSSSLSAGKKNNVSLVGNSTNAHLLFSGLGQLEFGDQDITSAIQRAHDLIIDNRR
jgi:hypothetical protein